MSPNRNRERAGISMIEMLIVIAIVVLLVGLLLPVLQRIRHQAALKQTYNQLKEVALSLHKCHDIHKRFPPAWGPFPPPYPPGAPATVPSGTLHYWLLPFLKADDVFNSGQPAATGGTPKPVWTNPDCYSLVVPQYLAPADHTTVDGTVQLEGTFVWGAGCFAANARVFGGLRSATDNYWDNKARFATISDGTSNRIAFATRYARCGAPPGGSGWAGGNTKASFGNFIISGAFFASDVEDKPVTGVYTTSPPFQVVPSQGNCDPLLAHGYSRAGIQVAMFDGSVRTVSPSISSATWGQACHPSNSYGGSDWQ